MDKPNYNPLARSIVAMLIRRKRKAYRQWMCFEDSGMSEASCEKMHAAYREITIAVDNAKALLEY